MDRSAELRHELEGGPTTGRVLAGLIRRGSRGPGLADRVSQTGSRRPGLADPDPKVCRTLAIQCVTAAPA